MTVPRNDLGMVDPERLDPVTDFLLTFFTSVFIPPRRNKAIDAKQGMATPGKYTTDATHISPML